MKAHIEAIKENLVALGVYRAELDPAIRELAMLRMLSERNWAEWQAAGFPMVSTFINKNGTENEVKSQYLQNHQQLDDKILRREKELGLTTYSMDKLGILEKVEEDPLDKLVDQYS